MKRFLVILAFMTGPLAFGQHPQKTIKEFLKLSASDTTSYVVKGVVSKVRSSSSGSFYLDDKTGSLLVYGLQDPANPGSSFRQMDIVKGDTLSVLGRFTIYGGTTLEMKDGRLLSKADGPDHNLSFYDRLERKPVFKGKEGQEGQDVFRSWAYAHAVMPEGAQPGSVHAKYVIGRKGAVQEVEILESPSPALSAETKRVLESSPAWKPAVLDGTPVRMTQYITINFDSSLTGEAAAPSFLENTFADASAGFNLHLAGGMNFGLGYAAGVHVGKWFSPLRAVRLGWTGGSVQGTSYNFVQAEVLYNLLRSILKENTGRFTMLLKLPAGVEFIGSDTFFCTGLGGELVYSLGSNLDLFAEGVAIFDLDPHNQGRIPFVSAPRVPMTLGVRYNF